MTTTRIDTFSNLGFDAASNFVNVDDILYFSAVDALNGGEPRRIIPGEEIDPGNNPALVGDVNPGPGSSSSDNFTRVGDTVYFTANDGFGVQLWEIPFPNGEPQEVLDAGSSFIFNPDNLTNVNGTLYFTANNNGGGELWRILPGSLTATQISNNFPGFNGSAPANLANVGGVLYFTAIDNNAGLELWRIDPTTNTPANVADIDPGFTASNPSNLVDVNGTLYFTATTSLGEELYRIDRGTTTVDRVADINPGAGSSTSQNLINVGGTLYFTATNGQQGPEVFRLNALGQPEQIRINTVNSLGSNPANLINANGFLYFTADDNINGRELWRLSPGEDDPKPVRIEINNGVADANPVSLVTLDKTLYFTADDGTNSFELWRVDPNSNQAALVRNLNTRGDSNPGNLTVVGEQIYFTITNVNGDPELWTVSNTEAASTATAFGITGPTGVGSANWINLDGQPLTYVVNFANQDGAAPVTSIIATQTLDANLNLDTFTLGDVSFSSLNDPNFTTLTIDVPSGLQTYEGRVNITKSGTVVKQGQVANYAVDLEGSLNKDTREVIWKLTTIDLSTGEVIGNPDKGFLKPGVQGSINYTVEPTSEANRNGTQIAATAQISFDTNAFVDAPVTSNTFDTEAPNSEVTPLPATVDSPAFNVQWSGRDSGSGVASYDVFVSANNGAFELWQNDTTTTSATYGGQVGSSYRFYSVATDQVGLMEPTPNGAQAATRVIKANFAPTGVAPFETVANENAAPGTVIGRLTAIDPDTDDSHTYTLVDDAGGAFFLSGNSIVVAQGADLDFETNPTRQVRVRVTDSSGASTIQAVTIRLNDLAEGSPGGSEPKDQVTFAGTAEADDLTGNALNNRMFGGGSNDILRGAGGDDTIAGGQGEDLLLGEDGDDILKGRKGDDTLRGGNGNDLLHGGNGRNVLMGGQGSDTFIVRGAKNFAIIRDFTVGEDRIQLGGQLGFDDLTLKQTNRGVVLSRGSNDLGILIGVNESELSPANFAGKLTFA